MSQKYNCPICKTEIPEERIEILRDLKYDECDFYCVKHALNRTVKGIYTGEYGTSDLIMCDRVYNDTVRAKFYDSENLSEPEDVVPDEDEDETEV